MAQVKPSVRIDGKSVPRFLYGTAWKKSETEKLTFQALKAGFRAIDTANQRKHYYEVGAGKGLKKFLDLGQAKRSDIFLQTKFTYAFGQDHRLPFDPKDSIRRQVASSFASSLKHLQTDYVDSYILHGPWNHERLSKQDLDAWKAMEDLVDEGKVKFLGISNVGPHHVEALCRKVRIKPTFVQNRCIARFGWDEGVREVCLEEGIQYQGFSLVRANLADLDSPFLRGLMKKYKKSLPQLVFRFCQQMKFLCITGTTDAHHMRDDLKIYDFELTKSEMAQIKNLAAGS